MRSLFPVFRDGFTHSTCPILPSLGSLTFFSHKLGHLSAQYVAPHKILEAIHYATVCCTKNDGHHMRENKSHARIAYGVLELVVCNPPREAQDVIHDEKDHNLVCQLNSVSLAMLEGS